MIDHKQELFDKVSKHLLTQNAKSVRFRPVYDQWPECRYRGDNHLSCAVGCLIDDKYYNPDCEGVSVPTDLANISSYSEDKRPLVLANSLTKSLGYSLNTAELSLLRSLQFIHDTYEVEDWKRELKDLAFREGLTFNEGSA